MLYSPYLRSLAASLRRYHELSSADGQYDDEGAHLEELCNCLQDALRLIHIIITCDNINENENQQQRDECHPAAGGLQAFVSSCSPPLTRFHVLPLLEDTIQKRLNQLTQCEEHYSMEDSEEGTSTMESSLEGNYITERVQQQQNPHQEMNLMSTPSIPPRQDEEIMHAVESCILSIPDQHQETPSLDSLSTWNDSAIQSGASKDPSFMNSLVGLDAVIQTLKERILFPLTRPELFLSRNMTLSQNLLLYGPSGCGKTSIFQCLVSHEACASSITFFQVSSSDLLSEWCGKSEKFVKYLFQIAQERQPSCIFLDECDSLCSQRSAAGQGASLTSEVSSRIKTEFLVRLSELNNSRQSMVCVIGATNLPWILDPAIVRRFQSRIYVPLPNEAARRQYLMENLSQTSHELNQEHLTRMAQQTEGFSMSDLRNWIEAAKMGPLRRMQKVRFWRLDHTTNEWCPESKSTPQNEKKSFEWDILPDTGRGIRIPPMSWKDFPSLGEYRSSVCHGDLKRYEWFHEKCGTERGSTDWTASSENRASIMDEGNK